MPQPDRNTYTFGHFRLDAAERVLYHGENLVPLAPKALEILLVLVRHAGHVVSKEELMQEVWRDTFVEEGNLNVNIFALRKALHEENGNQVHIETIPRRGFRFIAPVQLMSTQPETFLIEAHRRAHIVTEEIVETSAQNPSSPLGTTASAPALPSPAVWRRPIAFATISILLAAIIGLAEFRIYEARNKLHSVNSIAVLPFNNVGSDPRMDFLTDGLTESLINNLSQLPNFKVVSRTSAFHYKGKEISPHQVANHLSVHALVTGQVVQQGSDLRISVELVDAEHDWQMWGKQYQTKAPNLLALQSEITQEIARHLTLPMTGPQKTRLSRSPTISPEAYQLYLKGRYYWAKRGEADLRKALDYYNQAIAKDPGYALAYAGAASSYDLLGEYALLSPGEAFAKARTTATKAIELDDSLGEAHAAMGNVLFDQDWDFTGAEREYRRAIELNPSLASAHQWYAELLSKMARHDEAIAEARQGKELDPLALQVNAILGQVYLYAGRSDAAVEQARYVLELDPGFAFGHYVLGQIYCGQGNFAEATAEMQKVIALEPKSNRYRAYLGYIYARSGQTVEARRLLTELLKESTQEYIPWAHVAIIYAGLGDTRHALDALEQAYQLRDPDLPGLKVDPRFAGLRGEPRFQELMRRVGL